MLKANQRFTRYDVFHNWEPSAERRVVENVVARNKREAIVLHVAFYDSSRFVETLDESELGANGYSEDAISHERSTRDEYIDYLRRVFREYPPLREQYAKDEPHIVQLVDQPSS